MTVQGFAPPALRPYRGYADPALPLGYWFYENSTLGDGTGGLNIIRVDFQEAGEPSPSIIWNLEQFNLHTTNFSVFDARLTILGMDRIPQLGAGINITPIYHLSLGPISSGSALNTNFPPMPLFLGQPIDNGLTGAIQFDLDNVTGQAFLVHAQGFYWGPAAMNAPGGPQRPATSAYGR